MTVQNNNSGQQQQPSLLPAKIDALKKFLDSDGIKDQLMKSLADNSESFIASVIDLYTGDPYLQGCQPADVVMQAVKAAVLRLPLVKSLGFAYLVPYKKDGKLLPQFQIGYKGLIQLAMRTGQYKHLNADIVYEGEFRTANKLTGEFDLSGLKKSETIVGYFAHFEMLNGFSKTLYMTKANVTAHAQKYSKSFNVQYSPWKTEFDKMSVKTVLRLLLTHWGFLSVEMMTAMDEDIDRDVADEVLDEIRNKANTKEMNFQGAEEIHDMSTSNIDNNNQGGPGF